MLQISVDISGAQDKLNKVLRNAKGFDWASAGNNILSSIKHNFSVGGRYSEEKSAIGGSRPWAARKKRYPWPVLRKTGNLENNLNVIVGQYGVMVTSTLPYSAAQNYGYLARNLVARPFLVIQPQDIEKIKQDFIKNITKK